jgi:hypothetical protein
MTIQRIGSSRFDRALADFRRRKAFVLRVCGDRLGMLTWSSVDVLYCCAFDGRHLIGMDALYNFSRLTLCFLVIGTQARDAATMARQHLPWRNAMTMISVAGKIL